MPNPTLLIVTNKADPHADEVIRLLEERQTLSPFRLNSEDLFDQFRYTFCWQSNGQPSCSNLSMLNNGRSIDAIQVGWWRKPAPLQPSSELVLREAVRVATEEGKALLHSLDASFPCLTWVNRPEILTAAGRKLQQFEVARAAGLSIPETIVTNRGIDVLNFVKRYPRCIIKPLRAGSFMHEGKQWGLFTHRLTPADIDGLLDLVDYAPVMIQRELQKYQELRITVTSSS